MVVLARRWRKVSGGERNRWESEKERRDRERERQRDRAIKWRVLIVHYRISRAYACTCM